MEWLEHSISWWERFWSHVQVGGADDCWPWKLSRSKHGYGQLRVKRQGRWRTDYAHRMAHIHVYGAVAAAVNVCHTCDNPPCCNPLHTFRGTWAENMEDKVAKGRQARGEMHGMRLHPERARRGGDHYNARLTADRVREIRSLVSAGHEQKQVAKRFGVHPVTVHDVVHGKTWKAVS